MKALVDLASKKLVLVQERYFPVEPNYKWVPCADDAKVTTHIWDGNNVVVNPDAKPPVWYVLKSTIRQRMGTKSDILSTLGDWWTDAPAIRNSDPEMISTLEGVGLDPSIVLAKDSQAAALFNTR